MHSRQSPTLSVLNPKSSVLCPNTNRITSQYLALEQIKAHQDMLSRAKGSVDSSAPKSLQSYLNGINKKKKSYWQQEKQFPSNSKLNSAPLNHLYQAKIGKGEMLTENKNENIDDHVSTSVNKSIQTGVAFSPCQSKVGDKISWYLEAVSQGEFQQVSRDPHTMPSLNFRHTGSLMSLSSSLRSGRIVKGDLIEWHKDNFISPHKPFSPRVLANNDAKSKLVNMRCYSSSRRRKKASSIHSSDTFESLEDEENDSGPSQQNDNDVDDDNVVDDDDDIEEEIEKPTDEVPIKSKALHQDWLNEQAIRAQLRRNLKTRTPKNSPLRARDFHSRINSLKFNTLSRDEEEKYLKFLSDVTDDILRSGIYTDSAIERAFQLHLQFHSKDTDKEKLQQLLSQVLSGLQLHNEDNDNSNSNITGRSPFPKTNTATTLEMNGKKLVTNLLNQDQSFDKKDKVATQDEVSKHSESRATDQVDSPHDTDTIDTASQSSGEASGMS